MSSQVKNTPPIQVRFISEFLWVYGYEKAFDLFMNWFKEFNSYVIGNRISRLDICFDTDEVFFNEKDKTNMVTKARNIELCYPESINYKGRKFTGFVVGKGSPLSCRIYNKTIEIMTSGKEWFKEIWANNGWNVERAIWRVEFQIRREVLKELAILRVEDIEKDLNEIWAYLTQKWLTFRVVNNKNISRCKIHKKWLVVQKFNNNNYIAIPTVRKSIINCDTEKLINQCIGIIKSIAATTGAKNIYETCLILQEHAIKSAFNKGTTFELEIAKRKNRFIG